MSASPAAVRRLLPALCLAAALPLAMSACAGPRAAAEMPSSTEQSAAAGQTPVEPTAPARPAPPPPRPSCNAEAAKAGAIGKTADAATVERARAAAGGHTVRVLKPGQAITKEYLDGRVNVRVDENNVVVEIGCG
ncbi:I78 family peptidase inhibitor [Lysobacter enzymogenes]|uniref:Peptidase inhibitor I78 family protein n=1 Tax=Lysobacter enzymogenes TaxID=69 RepID=A0A3N2RNB6_LYSEN|nr:I78 family peptidase inhibitor [Lysobacter enzymogenes]ROU08937.1 Elastase inhibitor AFLEI Flags: Precursor [Lysobacter enzymogenes]